MTALRQLYSAIVHNKKEPPKGVITASVSNALQEHECATARLQNVVCKLIHDEGCQCSVPLPGVTQ